MVNKGLFFETSARLQKESVGLAYHRFVTLLSTHIDAPHLAGAFVA